MTDDAPTTSETILASATGETDPKALSVAAETSAPETRGADQPSVTAARDVVPSAAADHETRLQRLEDELAFLRKMFGWPEHTH